MSKRILIASESAYRRTLLTDMLSSHKSIIVISVVRNNQEAESVIENQNPEVLILDIEYRNKEWHSAFIPIIKRFKLPTIVLTDLDPKKMDALDVPFTLKFYDYIVKPEGIWKDVIPTIKDKLISKIILKDIGDIYQIDNQMRLLNKQFFIKKSHESKRKSEFDLNNIKALSPKHRAEEYFFDLTTGSISSLQTKVIVIGASVGGPRTLRLILSDIPRDFHIPILVVQHLNHLFMRQFATSLKDVCKVDVKIGINYEEIKPGIIYLSPGDKHMQVTVKMEKPCLRTFEGEPVNFCRPSVDVLFYSTARIYKDKTLGILLTGMGKDGVEGLRMIRNNGGKTIAESEETSILYGMPKVAAETGVADLIIPNYKIVDEIIRFAS
jgi:two-component system chemotaxis response regulator CheB